LLARKISELTAAESRQTCLELSNRSSLSSFYAVELRKNYCHKNLKSHLNINEAQPSVSSVTKDSQMHVANSWLDAKKFYESVRRTTNGKTNLGDLNENS
jgi:hypothetical protein